MSSNRNRDLDSDDEGPPAELDSEGFVVPGDDDHDAEEEEEEEEENLPPRRKHKYTTRDLQPDRPWKRWCLICLAILVTIGIMILISIFLQKLFDPPEDKDWSDSSDNVTDDDGLLSGGGGGVDGTSSSLLSKNSDYIDNICSEEKISAPESRQACEQICSDAMECCNPYANGGNSSCFQEEIAGCSVAYSQCHALDGTSDPAHNDLDRICSRESLLINPMECQLACSALECCYTDIDNCAGTSSNFQACLDYAACQNLKLLGEAGGDDNRYISVAKSSLEEECDNQQPVCPRNCRPAIPCCSDPNSDCYRDNFITCLTYSSCNLYESTPDFIRVAPIYSRVKKAPDNIQKVCLQSYVDSTGPEECQAICAAADCCFIEDGGASSCFGDDPLGCMEYRLCSVLL